MLTITLTKDDMRGQDPLGILFQAYQVKDLESLRIATKAHSIFAPLEYVEITRNDVGSMTWQETEIAKANFIDYIFEARLQDRYKP